MSVKEQAHYRVSAATLAQWIESQPERWWLVDGDPYLMSRVDFPCPSDELAPMIRKAGKDLLVLDKDPASGARGEVVEASKLDQFVDTRNRRHAKTLLLSWADGTDVWQLVEDEPLV